MAQLIQALDKLERGVKSEQRPRGALNRVEERGFSQDVARSPKRR
jgi:hypothetical protein